MSSCYSYEVGMDISEDLDDKILTTIESGVFISEDKDNELGAVMGFSVEMDGNDENNTVNVKSNTPYICDYSSSSNSSEIIEHKLSFNDNNKKVKLSEVLSNKEFIQNILISYNRVNDNKSTLNGNNDFYIHRNGNDNCKNSFLKKGWEENENIIETNLIESIQIGDDLNFNFNKESSFKKINNSCLSTGNSGRATVNDDSMKKTNKLVFDGEFNSSEGRRVFVNDESMRKAEKLVFGEDLSCHDNSRSKVNDKPQIANSLQNIHKDRTDKNLSGIKVSDKIKHIRNKMIDRPQKKRIIKRDELIIPNFFGEYEEMTYSDVVVNIHKNNDEIVSPTHILIDQSIETLKRYVFVLKKRPNDYIKINYERVYLEMEAFFDKYPIYPNGMYEYKLRWFQIQYLLVLYDECLKWIRRIKNKVKELGNIMGIFENVGYPSIKRVLFRICKRAIHEFFDAKRSPLVKICEGDFTISVPLNLRVLTHNDKMFVDEVGDQHKRKVLTCTDGWYIIKIHTVFPGIKNLTNIPRNIFVCGGNWLLPNTEFGHPLEIESKTLDYPNLLYGFNMIRPILSLKKFKLGFHFEPFLFRLKNLVTTSTLVMGMNGTLKEGKVSNSSIDCGGGLAFLVQIVVIHVFPMCYKELIDDKDKNDVSEDNDSESSGKAYYYITRDEDEMNISLNMEMQEMIERSHKSMLFLKEDCGNLCNNRDIDDSEDNYSQGDNIHHNNSIRRISIDSKMLVLDYWKYLEMVKRSSDKIDMLDFMENCSILTLPSGIDIDDLVTIKPGTVIRLSWMKVFRNNKQFNIGKVYSYSRLIPTRKTSLSLKKRVGDCQVLNRIISVVEKPVLVSNWENIDNISVFKGGWPLKLLGLMLYIYPIEERKRGYEHCFEFKILLISPTGCKIFIRVHTTGFSDSELRMCERTSARLNRTMSLHSPKDYRTHILLVENADFNYYERSTGLYYFNAKIPYSTFNIPYYPAKDYFSNSETQNLLLRTIQDLSFYTNCDLPTLFERKGD
ncbi:hypothetical protein FG386_002004 [Cryptosporidium ryanae]|uniref:uncharacterized protein n=1 Tax=Cryptosporidium ryanae TaxID=515981 RepID=UPI00351A5C9E|nr:hypothetical protein FG386_002004 [Cryptosporidium ryanae]